MQLVRCPPMHTGTFYSELGENGKGPAVLLIKGVQSGPPVDNIRLCGHFAASFVREITDNGDKLISNQV